MQIESTLIINGNDEIEGEEREGEAKRKAQPLRREKKERERKMKNTIEGQQKQI